jgi:hypothetical protein
MRIKVYNGTPEHGGGSLCTTCRHSTITRGQRLEEEIIRCEAQAMGTTRIHFTVTECSAYFDARAPTYRQLLEQAWILRPHTAKRPAGFVRARDLPPGERYRVMMDYPDGVEE